MTELAAERIETLQEPRLTLATLLGLRRLVTLYLPSLGSTDSEGSHDVASRSKAGATIRQERVRPCTTTSQQGRTAGNPRTGAMDKSTGEGDGRGGGQ